MKPYIFGKRNMIHIIDIKETLKGLLMAKKFLAKVVADGGDVLFVGTKRQAKNAIEANTAKCSMHFVSERWLGGTLTNFQTIRSRLARLEELEKLEETGEISNYSKKMVSTLQREHKKMKRNLDGIRKMTKLPAVMVIVDPGYEHIAVKEARKLKIPTVCLIDTEGDPDVADIPIPGNDDSMRAIDIVLRELASSVQEGIQVRPEEKMEVAAETPAGEGRPNRRHDRPSRRPPQVQTPAAPAESAPSAPETQA
jgi:small subunit ribosomal protein S2